MMAGSSRIISVLVVCGLCACGPSRGGGGDDTPEVDAFSECASGLTRCQGASYQTCTGGLWQTTEDCTAECVVDLGCTACVPNSTYCQDGNVYACDATGNPGGEIEACPGTTTCAGGVCVNACDEAAAKSPLYRSAFP